MIPIAYIDEWRQQAPWVDSEMVEQDLIISRAIACLYQHPLLQKKIAFRGGTALNKLYIKPAARYSEDIDLVQIDDEPIGEILSAIRSVLDPWLGKARWSQKQWLTKLIYRIPSTMGSQLRLKLEINTAESFVVDQHQYIDYAVESSWFSTKTKICTYSLDELMATKLRALYQRRKGRDLFDIWIALNTLGMNCGKLIKIFHTYNEQQQCQISRAQFEKNMHEKMQDEQFLSDTYPLLRDDIEWNPEKAYSQIEKKLLPLLPGQPWQGNNELSLGK